MLQIRDLGLTARQISDIKFRDVGNVLKDVSFIKVRDASGTLRTVWQRLSLSATTYVEGYGNSNSPVNITTSPPNPVVAGGRAPFTYAWAGGAAGWTILYPSQINTSFRRNGVTSGEMSDTTFTLTVTDADGNTASIVISAHVENLGGTA